MNARLEAIMDTVGAAIDNTYVAGDEYVANLLKVAPGDARAIMEAERVTFAETAVRTGAENALTLVVQHALTVGVMAERLRAAEAAS